MSFEARPGSVTGLPDDQLATAAVSLVVSELQWTPDVAPAVLDRISRDAVAYPELFDRRALPKAPPLDAAAGRSAGRTVGRITVLGVLLVVIVALVVLAATARGAAADGTTADRAAIAGVAAGGVATGGVVTASSDDGFDGHADPVPSGAMRGTLVWFGVDEAGELHAVGQGGSILLVVTEAS